MGRRRLTRAGAAGLALVLVAGATWALAPGNPGPGGAPGNDGHTAERTAARQPRLAAGYGRLPLGFTPTQGEAGTGADFMVRGRGFTMAVGPTRSTVALSRPGKPTHPPAGTAFAMELVGASPAARPAAQRRLPGTTNFLLGPDPAAWRTGVASYAEVAYHGVYPGIDVVWRGDHGKLEYDFVLAPGADPAAVALRFDGVDELSVDRSGDLVLEVGGRQVRQRRPVLYQHVGGARRTVAGSYRLGPGDRVGFRVGPYDPNRALVIDPVLAYSTYLGGIDDDGARAVAVDAAGSAWIAGDTPSSPTFPTTPGAVQPEGDNLAVGDAFVAKLRPDGSALDFATYLGGTGADAALGIAVDAAGAAYVLGSTASTDFPAANPLQPANAGGRDAFVAKLDPTGSALAYSTYLGGSGGELTDVFGNLQPGAGIAVGPSGEATVAGTTHSVDFPTASPLQGARAGAGDAFVARLSPAGSSLAFSTYLGGTGEEVGVAVALDTAGAAYVGGETTSADFPTTAALQPTPSGAGDAFVAKLAPAGSSLAYSTYLGGSDVDAGRGIAVDTAGATYLTGWTRSADFPLATGATPLQAALAGGDDAFVAKLAPAGSSLAYSTYLGGSATDTGAALALWAEPGAAPHVVITGETTSADFPLARPVQARYGGSGRAQVPGGDGFVAELDATGAALVHATYLGGSGGDAGTGVGIDAGGNAYVVGRSASADLPTIAAVQTASAGGLAGHDALVAKLARSSPTQPVITALAPASGPAGIETTVVITGTSLGGGGAVAFGALPAVRFHVDSPTRVTAVAPAQPEGSVEVRVSAPGGTSAPTPFGRFSYAEGAWRATAPPPGGPRLAHSATALGDGRVLVAGGCLTTLAPPVCESGTITAGAALFDPRTETWSEARPLATPRYGHSSTLLPRGQVLVAGGIRPGGGSLPDVELYDPVAGTWGALPSLPTARAFHTATLLEDGTVLVVGGQGGGARLASADRYHPASATWTSVATNFPHSRHSATLLPAGRVLVVGGDRFPGGCDGCPPPPEVFDPATGAFVPAPDHARRFAHAAAALAGPPAACGARCGQALVAGGLVDSNFFRQTAQADLFVAEGGAGRWSPARPLALARATHTATALASGKVLVAGGTAGRSAEVYDPISGRWSSAGVALAHRMGTTSAAHTATLVEGGIATCGTNCGTVLLVGAAAPGDPVAELYTPRPTMATVSPSQAPASGGFQVVLSGSGFANGVRAVTFGGRPAGFSVDSPTRITAATPPGTEGPAPVVVLSDGGVSAPAPFAFTAPAAVPSGGTGLTSPTGYRLVAADGGVFAFGAGPFLGSTGGQRLNQPVVGMASTPTGRGYWLVARDGGVFAFGDAGFFGSTGAMRLNQPVVGMAATPTGRGYWLAAADGGVFAFGDARFAGSTGGIRLAQPVVGMGATPTGAGYRLVAADGGVFAFGDAGFHGSTGRLRLNQPVVGTAATPSGRGYWLVARDGGVFAFGDALFAGSTGAMRLNQPVVSMAATPPGTGYWLVAADGGVFAFGGAPFLGSTATLRLRQPVVGIAAP